MFSRFIRATCDFTRQKASQSAAWAVVARDTVSGFLTTAHHMLMILGVIAIGALTLMFVKPEVADRLKALSPFTAANASEQDDEASLADAQEQSSTQTVLAANRPHNSREQQWVTSWLAKRYRVAADATDMLVSAAYMAAKETKLDPLLILSVMAIESRFNPFAESPVGAQGLMQVMSKVHQDKFEDHGGVKAALDPVANIKVGSLILKDYVKRGGSVEAGLKLYVGAGAFDTDFGYGSKVLAEYQRLKDVAMGKKVPIYSTPLNTTSSKPNTQERKANNEEEKSGNKPEQPAAIPDQVAAL